MAVCHAWPVIRPEGAGRQARAVTDFFWIGNQRRRDDNGVAIDPRIGPVPLAVLSSDGKLSELRSLHNKAAVRAPEVQADFPWQPIHGLERWARIHHTLSVIIGKCANSQPLANRLFHFCMNVIRVPSVHGDGEAGVGNGGRSQRLGLAGAACSSCFNRAIFTTLLRMPSPFRPGVPLQMYDKVWAFF